MPNARKYPSIPAPRPDIASLVATLAAVKQTLDILTGVTGDGNNATITSASLPAALAPLTTAGLDGAPGARGPMGYSEDGADGMTIPGPAGATGPDGLRGAPGQDGEDSNSLMWPPGVPNPWTIGNALIYYMGGNVGINTMSPDGRLIVNNNGAAIPASPAGTVIRVIGADATQGFLVFDAYGNNGGLLFERWGGTLGSETPLATNENIGVLLARGYDGSVMTGNRFSMQFRASGAWSTSNHGTYLVINTTTQGTVVGAVERMRIDGVGSVEIGGATDAAASAVLDVVSTTKGALLPRMTEAQRDAISSPATGLEVYVTGFGNKSIYDGTGWSSLAPVTRRTTAIFTKTADVTLADVTGLTVNVAAGKSYVFRAVLHVSTGAGSGSQYAIAGTATATSVKYEVLAVDNTALALVIASKQVALAGAAGQTGAGAQTIFTTIEGQITVNAAGTLTVQFAENVAVNASSILAGSYFEVQEVR